MAKDIIINQEEITKFLFSTFLSFLRKQESLSFNRLDTPAFAGVTKNDNFAIASQIKRDGFITVHGYMELCTTHYYATRDTFGVNGDFTITTPETQ